jgi:hypothetical protein
MYPIVDPWCVQAADTARKVPANVRATMRPLVEMYPPLFANVPEATSIVKSTLVGAAGKTPALEQLDKDMPKHAGSKRAAAPVPTCARNSLRFIILLKLIG